MKEELKNFEWNKEQLKYREKLTAIPLMQIMN